MSCDKLEPLMVTGMCRTVAPCRARGEKKQIDGTVRFAQKLGYSKFSVTFIAQPRNERPSGWSEALYSELCLINVEASYVLSTQKAASRNNIVLTLCFQSFCLVSQFRPGTRRMWNYWCWLWGWQFLNSLYPWYEIPNCRYHYLFYKLILANILSWSIYLLSSPQKFIKQIIYTQTRSNVKYELTHINMMTAKCWTYYTIQTRGIIHKPYYDQILTHTS